MDFFFFFLLGDIQIFSFYAVLESYKEYSIWSMSSSSTTYLCCLTLLRSHHLSSLSNKVINNVFLSGCCEDQIR